MNIMNIVNITNIMNIMNIINNMNIMNILNIMNIINNMNNMNIMKWLEMAAIGHGLCRVGLCFRLIVSSIFFFGYLPSQPGWPLLCLEQTITGHGAWCIQVGPSC